MLAANGKSSKRRDTALLKPVHPRHAGGSHSRHSLVGIHLLISLWVGLNFSRFVDAGNECCNRAEQIVWGFDFGGHVVWVAKEPWPSSLHQIRPGGQASCLKAS
jgi:hypothetical protein